MNIKSFFEDNRKQSIESLEFYMFLAELYVSLLSKSDETKNAQVNEFIKVIEENFNWQSYKVNNYKTILYDYVFWKSSEIYIENMQKFISYELSGVDFVYRISSMISNDRKKCNLLLKNFEKQLTLELDPKIFQFSKIII